MMMNVIDRKKTICRVIMNEAHRKQMIICRIIMNEILQKGNVTVP